MYEHSKMKHYYIYWNKNNPVYLVLIAKIKKFLIPFFYKSKPLILR